MKILVVDDEFVALQKMLVLLEPYGSCDAATHGEQAYEMFRKALMGIHPYDLVTIDIDMPGMNGLMLLRRLREAEEAEAVPPARKLIVSANANSVNVTQAMLQRCDGFLVKPIRREALVHKLVDIGVIAPERAAP